MTDDETPPGLCAERSPRKLLVGSESYRAARMNFRLELAETPPSLNRFGSVGGGTYFVYTRLKKEWQQTLGIALMAAGVPRGLAKVSASATMRFSVRRKRDEGNFRFLLEKALGDTLVKGGWLEDDTGAAFTFGAVTFDPEVGTPLTIIELEVEEAGQAAAAISPNAQRESPDKPKLARGAEPVEPGRRWRRGVKG